MGQSDLFEDISGEDLILFSSRFSFQDFPPVIQTRFDKFRLVNLITYIIIINPRSLLRFNFLWQTPLKNANCDLVNNETPIKYIFQSSFQTNQKPLRHIQTIEGNIHARLYHPPASHSPTQIEKKVRLHTTQRIADDGEIFNLSSIEVSLNFHSDGFAIPID